MQIKKYDFFEVRFQSDFTGNPFNIELTVHIKCPDGTTKKVYGFYDGENTFAFRFMPEVLGKYDYETVCKIDGLNHKTGNGILTMVHENNFAKGMW